MREPVNFYRFGNNSSYNRRFTWAMSIIPRSEMVYRVCPRCSAVQHYPSGAFDVIVERGSQYPDVLGCGAYPFLIVSEEVIAVWIDAGISSFYTFPVDVAKVQSRKLRDIRPPQYFRVEIDGRCQIDLAASGIEVITLCAECHHLVTRPSLAPGFRMVPGSWDGSDLFRDPDFYPRVNFCTQSVLDLAREHQLTNFRFDPMDQPYEFGSRGIDYLKGQREVK
ncbi:MAG: hypothetical protein HYX94_01800 [Chloroflexi bacterium]|nr:hypothetical protein [Chloroflexota bacterium]